MGRTRTRRIGRRDAELLVRGVTGTGFPALARLLRLAAGPASARELAGGPEAASAMAAVYRDRPAGPWRRPLSVLSRALAVKVAAAVGVLLLGGTAVATGTGGSVFGVPVPDRGVVPSPRASPTRTPSPRVPHGNDHTHPSRGVPRERPVRHGTPRGVPPRR